MKSVKIVSLNAAYSLECADIRDIIKCWKQHNPKEEEKLKKKKKKRKKENPLNKVNSLLHLLGKAAEDFHSNMQLIISVKDKKSKTCDSWRKDLLPDAEYHIKLH